MGTFANDSVPHHDAEVEYVEVVITPLRSLLQSYQYTSYRIPLAHASYSRHQTVPVVILVAGNLKIEHAKQLLTEFDYTKRDYISELFCYEGEDLQAPQDKVDCGYSIGP